MWFPTLHCWRHACNRLYDKGITFLLHLELEENAIKSKHQRNITFSTSLTTAVEITKALSTHLNELKIIRKSYIAENQYYRMLNTRTAEAGCFQLPPVCFFRCNSKTSEATILKLCIAVHQTILHHL